MLIESFSDNVLFAITQVTTETVTGFLPMVGREYSGQIMVVGGWTKGIAPTQLGNDVLCLDYARSVYQSVTESMLGECPMSWVTACWGATKKYNTRRSAFWRVIRAVVGRLDIANVDDDQNPWPSHLVWSNLYKIAPVEGGNPDGNLQQAQFKGCVKLLQWELKNYQPRRLLFLTGRAWADPFLREAWQDRALPEGQSFVEATGHVKCGPHAATCVVAKHPQGKNETDWVNEVVAAFG
jgi:hypothetical protein